MTKPMAPSHSQSLSYYVSGFFSVNSDNKKLNKQTNQHTCYSPVPKENWINNSVLVIFYILRDLAASDFLLHRL